METAIETPAASVHPLSHLGPAPYKFIGVSTSEHREELNIHLAQNGLTYTANLCGGTCDHCGTPIENVYQFSAANGRAFKLGCDCAEVAFASSPKIALQILNARRAQRRAVNRALRESRTAAQKEAEKAARVEHDARAQEGRAAVEKGLYERNPEWKTAIEALLGVEGFPGSFAADQKARIAGGLELTSKQSALLARLYDEATSVDTGFVGTVGKRIELTLTVVSVTTIDSQFGMKLLYTTKDSEGHFVTCFHSGSPWYVEGAESGVATGDALKVRATIKAHEVYRGRSQTVIQRATVLGVAA